MSGDNSANKSEYQEFSQKFTARNLPFALPGDMDDKNATELDKKYIKDLLTVAFTPAFGKDDVLPGLNDNIDVPTTKYYSSVKLKLDSFDAYVIHKQDDDDYFFLCIFDKQGRFMDGTCIAFTEGSDADGTIREASINEDCSIEISQHNVLNGKVDQSEAERHFYVITSHGKIRDLKENAISGNA